MDLDGSGEVELATYKHSNTEDLLGEMALARMVVRLSPRNYSAASNRSATSRRFESMIAIGRTTMRNVKRRRDGMMIERWTAAGMLEAEKRFWRVQGYRDISALKAARRTCLREVIGSEEKPRRVSVGQRRAVSKIHDGRDILNSTPTPDRRRIAASWLCS
jgi:hypothetical protein